MQRTKRAAVIALAVIGGWAAFGVLYEEGNELADKGWDAWANSSIRGTSFVVLSLTLICLVIVAFIASGEAVNGWLERKQLRQEMERQRLKRMDERRSRDEEQPG